MWPKSPNLFVNGCSVSLYDKGSAAVRVCSLSARTTVDLSACHTVGEEATEIDLSWAPTRTPWQRES